MEGHDGIMKRQSSAHHHGETTIEDVATAAGVSVRTISRVINDSPLVNQATRLQVEQVIAHLKFIPSSRARGLALRRSFLIGLVHNDQCIGIGFYTKRRNNRDRTKRL